MEGLALGGLWDFLQLVSFVDNRVCCLTLDNPLVVEEIGVSRRFHRAGVVLRLEILANLALLFAQEEVWLFFWARDAGGVGFVGFALWALLNRSLGL